MAKPKAQNDTLKRSNVLKASPKALETLENSARSGNGSSSRQFQCADSPEGPKTPRNLKVHGSLGLTASTLNSVPQTLDPEAYSLNSTGQTAPEPKSSKASKKDATDCGHFFGLGYQRLMPRPKDGERTTVKV